MEKKISDTHINSTSNIYKLILFNKIFDNKLSPLLPSFISCRKR